MLTYYRIVIIKLIKKCFISLINLKIFKKTKDISIKFEFFKLSLRIPCSEYAKMQ